jgi:FG-GAP-like repeat
LVSPIAGLSDPSLVDIDGDGDFDAFFVSGGGNTLFFKNTGTTITPAFATPTTNPFGFSNIGSVKNPITLVDIDGDGDLDAFIGNLAGDTLF